MYLVIETQANSTTGIAYIVTQHSSLADAESKFHTVLSAAAVSSVEIHAASILDENGKQIRHEYYAHPAQVTPEPEE